MHANIFVVSPPLPLLLMGIALSACADCSQCGASTASMRGENCVYCGQRWPVPTLEIAGIVPTRRDDDDNKQS